MRHEYKTRQDLRPRDLRGISEEQIALHWALYEGYVKNVNALNGRLADLSKKKSTGWNSPSLSDARDSNTTA